MNNPYNTDLQETKRGFKFMARVHPLAKIFISLGFILPVFLTIDPIAMVLFLSISTLTILVFDYARIKSIIIVMLVVLPVGISILILNSLYGKSTSGEVIFYILNNPIYRNNLNMGISLGLRAFSLGMISISWVLVIDFDRVIKGLMQSFNLNPKIGFSLFVGINAIPIMGDEYRRIKNIKLIREIKKPMPVAIIVNILSQAVRYSERTAISMVSRGLGKKRVFVTSDKLLKKDYIITIIFYIFLILISIILVINGHFKVKV